MANLGDDARMRAARKLARASALTRGIGLFAIVGALLGLFFALTATRGSDDRLGFSLISLSVLVIATLVWATGTFHGAVGQALPTLSSIDRKVDLLAEALRTRDRAEPAPDAAPAPNPPAELPPPISEAKPAPAPRPPPPEPEKVPCPLCGGRIHPDATRCVHCMKKLPRPAAHA
jgi:hypothetical protein